MIFDSLDVSYGEMWGSYRGMTHPDPMSRALAVRRHAAGMDYAVLLSAREQPLALIERWPRGMWRVYLFDDRSWRVQMIDLKPHSTGMLLARWNTRWRFSNEQAYSLDKWEVQETTTVPADGQVEVKSEFAGPTGASTEPLHARTPGPSSVPVRRFAAPVERFLCPVPEFGEWQVFAPFLAQQGHEPATTVVLNDVSVDEGSGPLRATGIEKLFSPGACDTPDGPAVVEPVDAGVLRTVGEDDDDLLERARLAWEQSVQIAANREAGLLLAAAPPRAVVGRTVRNGDKEFVYRSGKAIGVFRAKLAEILERATEERRATAKEVAA